MARLAKNFDLGRGSTFFEIRRLRFKLWSDNVKQLFFEAAGDLSPVAALEGIIEQCQAVVQTHSFGAALEFGVLLLTSRFGKNGPHKVIQCLVAILAQLFLEGAAGGRRR